MDLKHASATLARHVYLLALGALLMGALVYLWAVKQPATYQASAQIVVTLPDAPVTLTGFNSSIAIARRSAAARIPERVVEDAHNAVPIRSTARIRKALQLRTLAGQPAVVVTAHDADPAVAVSLANAASLSLATVDEVNAGAVRTTLANQISTLQAQLDALIKQITKTQALIATAKANRQDTTALETALSAQQASEQQILNQLSTTQAAYARPQAHFWVSQMATTADPEGLVEPYASLLGAVVGLFAGAGAALLLDLLDGIVRGPRDTERFAGLPTIASLAEPLDVDDTLGMVRPEGYFALARAYQGLLRNLAFLDATQRLRMVLVAAADGIVGADIIGIKLAITCAREKQPTLVLDANWNLPTLEERFGLPPSQSGFFTSLIATASEPRRALDAIRPTEISGLWALPLGPLPPNLDELMRTPLLDQLLHLLADRFQQIVVLAPLQLDSVAGRQLIERMDGVLVVVRAGATTGAELAYTARLLRRANAFLVGAALTNVEVSAVPLDAVPTAQPSHRLPFNTSALSPSRSSLVDETGRPSPSGGLSRPVSREPTVPQASRTASVPFSPPQAPREQPPA